MNLTKNLRKKIKRTGGFTLIEMLIVVAIIAILVAVSIPIINSAMEKTRIATDAANERAAKAEAEIAYLSEKLPDDSGTYYYDAVKGELVASSAKPTTGYGKCKTNNHSGSDCVIKVEIDDEGKVTISWDGTSAGAAHNSVVE